MKQSDIEGARGQALLNIQECLSSRLRFPRNVFVGSWDHYSFFDSDRVFDGSFVDQVKTLLDIEGATCACLVKLDAATETEADDRRFFIERGTTPESYMRLLAGEHTAQGWIFDFGRFGCASELSQWAIYCERNNEIATIAIKSNSMFEHYRLPLARLKASRISDAVSKPSSYGFSPEALSTEWRTVLLKESDVPA